MWKQAERVSLTGKITDQKSGSPLAGASVYFSDIKTGAVSNAQGVFRINNLRQGKYLVEISFVGHTSIVERIDISSNMQRDYSLKSSVAENEAVTVTGVSSATSVRKSPVPVDILRRQDFLRSASTNLIDALSKAPGVSQIATGPAISKPTIRGLGYNRLVVINDGVRQEGQQWGDEHGIEIDEYSVNKTEILKGPASIMYGSDALAGVVNILTNIPAPEGSIKANILTNYQTNNGLTGIHGNLNGNLNGLNWNAFATRKSAYDYTNRYDGSVFNSRFNEKNVGGFIGINKLWGYTHILVSHFNQHVGMIEGERDEATGAFLKLIDNRGVEEETVATGADQKSRDPYIPRQHIRHFKLSWDNSFHTRTGRISVNTGFQRNQRQEFGNVLDLQEKELYFDLKSITYNVQYHFPEKNNWQNSAGVSGIHQQNKNKGEEALIPEYALFDIGAFVYSKRSFDKLTLSGGLRYDKRAINSNEYTEGSAIKFDKFTRRFSNFSGSAGLSYEKSQDVTLKFNIARGFRAPTIPELSSNGSHEGTNRYEYGAKNLKSETSLQLDAGVEVNTEHVSLSANAFLNRINHFIYYRKLSSYTGGDSVVQVDGNDKTAFTFDQENALLFGGESNVDIHPHPLDWLHIENTFSYTRGMMDKKQDGSKNLPLIPAARLISQLRGDFSRKGKRIRNGYVSLELDNTFSQNYAFTGFSTESASRGYSLLNAGFGGDVLAKGQTLFSVYFAANNLANVAYQNHLSRLKYTAENVVTGRMGVFNMGRNVSMKLNVPLSFTVK